MPNIIRMFKFNFLIILVLSFFSVLLDAQTLSGQNSSNCIQEVSKRIPKSSPSWGKAYELCLQNMGLRQNSSGSYTQRYHYDNPKYKACVAKVGYNNSAAIDKCMAGASTSSSTPKSSTTKTPACPAGQEYDSKAKKCILSEPVTPTEVDPNKGDKCLVGGKYIEPEYDFQTGKKECPTQPDFSKAPAEQEQRTANSELRNCMERWDNQVKLCKSQAAVANRSCDEKQSDNAALRDYKNVLGQTGGALTGAQIGSGAADQCVKAGLITSTGVFAMDSMKQDCEEDYGQCKRTCENINPRSIEQCLNVIRRDQAGNLDPNDSSYFSSKLQQVSEELEEAKNECLVEAKQEKDALQSLMNSLGRSAQQAKQCECQLTTGGTNCPSIPSPTDCLPGGRLYSQPACGSWNNNSCVLGSPIYNTKDCICLRDPTNVACRKENFAGNKGNLPSLNSSTGGGGLTGGSSNSLGKVNLGDINDPESPEAIKDKEGNNVSAGFNTPGSGGAGGVGGGGAGASAMGLGEHLEDDDHEEKGISGMFGQLKTTIGSIFGSKGNSGAGGFAGLGKGKGAGSPDFDKWRPKGVRGLASDGIGGRNTDIWLTMNRRYRENSHTFLNVP